MKKLTLTRKSLIILIVSIVLTISALTATGVGVYAAYTNSRNAQRTIGAYDANGSRFSSNALGRGYAKDNVKTFYTTSGEHDPSTVVTIGNYERGKQTLYNIVDIPYSITARLVKYDALNEARYVPVDAAYISDNSYGSYTISITKGLTTVTLGGATLSDNSLGGTLIGRQTSTDAYTIVFDVEFATESPNLYLELTATPADANLPTLIGILRADLRMGSATNAWTGSFRDDTSNDPAEYHGFNYNVSGAGSGTCTLNWDSTKVVISDVSRLMLMSIAGATRVGDSITFPVDSDVEANYDLQFYKVNITNETWSDMEDDVVWLEFHA